MQERRAVISSIRINELFYTLQVVIIRKLEMPNIIIQLTQNINIAWRAINQCDCYTCFEGIKPITFSMYFYCPDQTILNAHFVNIINTGWFPYHMFRECKINWRSIGESKYCIYFVWHSNVGSHKSYFLHKIKIQFKLLDT